MLAWQYKPVYNGPCKYRPVIQAMQDINPGTAVDDTWSDPMSQYLAYTAADEVYRFLGKEGFVHRVSHIRKRKLCTRGKNYPAERGTIGGGILAETGGWHGSPESAHASAGITGILRSSRCLPEPWKKTHRPGLTFL